ncbi:SDR family oxidoreductase [Nafulsella turpanensis]|uniref:SDR family oxidoreductase n=1 Tax=Nafulsella turpanensis TaxID=1265690 RepID=UPI00037642F4|nr:SDR family oxidoreductase [Nafulsella turpanensis]
MQYNKLQKSEKQALADLQQLPQIQNQKVLVTGGAGFIGSHLVDRFLELGNEVVCLDNFSTGFRRNIEQALQNSLFSLVEGDIRHLDTCRELMTGVDFVFHQAALGSIPRSLKDPVTTNEVNVNGFINVLMAAKEAGVKRFIYAASSSAYGNHQGLPKVEDQIGQQLSPYAVSKYVNELYAKVFGSAYGMETIGLRYFNLFGERQDPNGAYAAVIPLFIKCILRGESPLINGDGTHSRDFTYVENAVEANILAATTNNPAAINEVFNIACGESTTLVQLIDYILQFLQAHLPDKEISITFGPERPGDIKHSLADISKARTILGYEPAYNVEKGLGKALSWYMAHI